MKSRKLSIFKSFKTFLGKSGEAGGLSNWQKFLVSFPTMPASLSNVLIHNAFIKYYTDIIGLDAKYIGIVYLIFGIWNAINDPAIGILLDRYKYNEKRGKYAYLMKVTTPITVLSSFGIIFCQPSWRQGVMFAFILILLFIYDITYTTFNISYTSYILVAAPGNKARVDVSIIKNYVAFMGGFFGSIIPTLLLVGDTNHSLTVILFSVVIGINSILYILALKPLKDKKEMYIKENYVSEESIIADAVNNMKTAMKSKSFITYVLFQIISKGPHLFYFTPFLYFMDYVLRSNGIQATLVDVIPAFIMFALSPILGKYIKIIGLKKSAIYGSIIASFGFLMLYFVNNIYQALLAYSILITFGAVTSFIHIPMLGAIIDEDEKKTGSRKAGFFNGLDALLTIPVNGIQAAIFMSVLSAFSFDSGAKVQSVQAIQGIRIGAGLIPFAFAIIGVIPLFFSPITKEKEMELSDFSEGCHGLENGYVKGEVEVE